MNERGQKSSSPPRAGTYTCPMHSEIRSNTPGSCPKYGMALEPVRPVSHAETTTIYTCPMHPQVQQDKPGFCPICGMALELKGGHGR
jgi:Cu+-exporting ATPase